jgi:hypothetical protein
LELDNEYSTFDRISTLYWQLLGDTFHDQYSNIDENTNEINLAILKKYPYTVVLKLIEVGAKNNYSNKIVVSMIRVIREDKASW